MSGPDNDVQLAMKCLAKTAPGSTVKFVRRAGAGTFPKTADLIKINPWLDGAKIMKCVLWNNPQPAVWFPRAAGPERRSAARIIAVTSQVA